MGGDCLGNICSVPVFLGTPESTRIGHSKATAKMWSSKSLPHEEGSRMDCCFCLHSPAVSPSSCLKSGRSAMVVVARIRRCVATGSSPLLFFESMPAWCAKAWYRQLRLVITRCSLWPPASRTAVNDSLCPPRSASRQQLVSL